MDPKRQGQEFAPKSRYPIIHWRSVISLRKTAKTSKIEC